MQNEAMEEQSRVHYASALHPKHSRQPIVRRRHSGSISESNSLHGKFTSRHGSSRTDSAVGRSNGGHPLTLDRNRSSDASGVTRPHLNRTIKRVDDEMHGSDQDQYNEALSHEEKEAEVIVHEILPTDSLVGVSLKYGINPADLRRVNHLWAGDSIHFRKVLYIPVDISPKVRDIARNMRIGADPLINLSTPPSSRDHNTTADSEPPVSLETHIGAGSGIQRVPVSRMSFFPPPATTGKTPSISSTSSPSFASNLKFLTSPSRYSSSPSLASILTALPIGASTRDDLLVRLSFDSTSSSVSDRSRSNFELLEGLELNVVANHSPENFKSTNVHKSFNTSNMIPDVSMSSLQLHPANSGSGQIPRTMPSRSAQQRNTQPHHISTTPPAAYIPHIPDRKLIRTVQMEPSPRMQIPVLRPRKSHSSSMNGNSMRTTYHSRDDVFELH